MIKFLIRMPCKLLDGNTGLVDVSVSGVADATDVTARVALQNANFLMLALDKDSGISPRVAEMLKTSRITDKLLTDQYDYKLYFWTFTRRRRRRTTWRTT
jgi:hypothetical protein